MANGSKPRKTERETEKLIIKRGLRNAMDIRLISETKIFIKKRLFLINEIFFICLFEKVLYIGVFSYL